jgi:O-antigen/teichoic acid export membrane protein
VSRPISSSIAAIIGAKAGNILLGILFTPILVRLLGTNLYGRYATLLAVFALINVVMSSGTNDSVRKYLSEDRSSEWKSSVFGFHVRVAFVLGVGTALALVASAHFGIVHAVLGPEYVALILIVAVYAVARQCREILLRSLMGLKLERFSEPLKFTHNFIKRGGALALVYNGLGVAGIFVADILASLLVAAITIWILSNYIDASAITSRESPVQYNEILRYAGGTILFFGLLTSLYQVDVLMLTLWTDSSTVGIYKGALTIAETLWILPTAIQLSMLQSTSEYWQKGKVDLINELSSRITRFVTLITVLMAIGLFVLADTFVPLYLGSEFESSITPLLYLLPGVVGFAIARPALAISQSKGDMRPIIVATFCCALINLLANVVLIPEYGMIGAAVGTSLGYGSLPLFQLVVAKRFGYNPFSRVGFARIIICAAPTAGLIYAVDRAIPSEIVSLATIPIVGGVCYVLLATAVGAITRDDLQLLAEKIPNKWLRRLKTDLFRA